MPESPDTIAIYARVSTNTQDPQRQLDGLREWVASEYPGHDTEEFVDIVSGSASDGRDEYDRLRSAIADGRVGVVVVDEISRLTRLGAGEVHQFLEWCLKHETSVRDREVGLSIDVTDSAVDRAVSELIVGVLGSLAKIEHKQKLRRIQSGIEAAQRQGKWSGRPPKGFVVEDGYLRVDTEEFLRVRGALERVAAGEQVSSVADDAGLSSSTLSRLYNERPELYLRGEAEDERVAEAVHTIEPLGEPRAEPDDSEERIREIVREELNTDV